MKTRRRRKRARTKTKTSKKEGGRRRSARNLGVLNPVCAEEVAKTGVPQEEPRTRAAATKLNKN